MLYNLRTTARGGGARDLERFFSDASVGGGVFSTEVGMAGQTIIIWPHQGLDSYGSLRNQAEAGRGAMGVDQMGKHEVEILRLAPFMQPLQPEQIGRVWELSWYDFPPGAVDQALAAFEPAIAKRQSDARVVGCWSVDIGPVEDRIYVLAAYRDWDHRDEAMPKLRAQASWPPQPEVGAVRTGSKLLLPARFSPLR
jgi:hypothetical protein